MAAWDGVLFVSKWVRALQMEERAHPADEEGRIIGQLRDLLGAMEYGYGDYGSLAAAVTRAWASFSDGHVGLGRRAALRHGARRLGAYSFTVTPRMGYTLMQLGAAFEKSFQASSPYEQAM